VRIRSIFLSFWTELKEEKSQVANVKHRPFSGGQTTGFDLCKTIGQKKSLTNSDGTKKLS
jgi:hypothetical protein